MLNQHIVETPENISFRYPVAGIGSRFLAILVDTLIQVSLYVLLLVILLIAGVASTTGTNEWVRGLSNYLVAGLFIVLFMIQFGYFIIVEILSGGQSPGKSIMGLRVVKENGYPLTAVDSIIRNLIRIVDFMPLGYGVGLLTMLLNDNAKRLGDYAVGTLVVRVGAPAKLADLNPRSRLTWTTPQSEFSGIGRLKEEEIELAESFLQRREIDGRESLGREIAQHLAARLEIPQGMLAFNPETPDEFLSQVVASYRHRQAGETNPGSTL